MGPALGPGLVTGATGLLGGHVVGSVLTADAEEVHLAVRARDNTSAASRYSALASRYGDDERLRLVPIGEQGAFELPLRLRWIIHCAAKVDFRAEQGVLESNVGTTWDLLRGAADRSDFECFVHISSLTIRTDSPRPFAETDLDVGQRFVSPYTLTKFLAETMIRKLHRDLAVTSVRLGTVLPDPSDLGSAMSDWFRTTVKLVAQGRLAAVPMACDQRFYPVLGSEAARIVVGLLLADDERLPEVLHLPARPGPTAGTVFKRLADELGIRPPRLLPQHSDEWQRFRAGLPPIMARVVDGLYPPPPADGRLAEVDSRASERWLLDHDLPTGEIDDSYWSALAASLRPFLAVRREVTPA